jgi:hypothetical protein
MQKGHLCYPTIMASPNFERRTHRAALQTHSPAKNVPCIIGHSLVLLTRCDLRSVWSRETLAKGTRGPGAISTVTEMHMLREIEERVGPPGLNADLLHPNQKNSNHLQAALNERTRLETARFGRQVDANGHFWPVCTPDRLRLPRKGSSHPTYQDHRFRYIPMDKCFVGPRLLRSAVTSVVRLGTV